MRITIEPDSATGLTEVTIQEPTDHGGWIGVTFMTALVPSIVLRGDMQAEICVPADAHLSTESWENRRLRSGVTVYKASEVPSDSDPI